MNTRSARRLTALALAITLSPGLALAEVSVQLDPQGHFRRLEVITRGRGPGRVIWQQVRPGVPLDLLLNPMGDNRGDLAPTIRLNPVTGAPWAFWSMNIANQKRIGYAYWNGVTWTAPALIVADPGPFYLDELDPSVAFSLDGRPFLVWSQAGQVSKILFSTLVNGQWTRPVLLSDPTLDSRRPTLVLNGLSAIVTYRTSSGPVMRTYDSAFLVQSAANNNLMDTPIPPGHSGDPGSGGTGDDGNPNGAFRK